MRKQIKLAAPGTTRRIVWAVLAAAAILSLPARAQVMSPGQLDNMVSRIALYPDPLLAQVLTAATYYDQIPDAAAYADQHSYLQGDELAAAIQADNVPWDPSVQALLPFPSVLDTMERDMSWTQALGEAVLNAREAVLDAVQRMRQRAHDNGNLRDCPQYRVEADGPAIEIVPADPGVIYVPVYDPYWIYARPRAGLAVGISFGGRIFIGASFSAFGWRAPGFDWRAHAVIIDNHVWERSAANRASYAHVYRAPMARRPAGSASQYHETHAVRPNRSDRAERKAPERH
jgi:hypothetical protein